MLLNEVSEETSADSFYEKERCQDIKTLERTVKEINTQLKMNSVTSKSVNKRRKQKNEDDVKFRWAADFLAGPGGYLEKAEVFSKWFKTLDEAKQHAQKYSEQEISDYPYSRGAGAF